MSGPPRLVVAPVLAVACLKVFSVLTWVLAALLMLLGLRAAFDEEVALRPLGAVVGAGASAAVAILSSGLARRIEALVGRT